MSQKRGQLDDLLDADEGGPPRTTRTKTSQTFFSPRLRVACGILLLVFIIVGTVTLLTQHSKTNNNNDDYDHTVQQGSDNDDQLPQLRSGSRRYSPDAMGHMDVYINKQRQRGPQHRPKRFQFPAARFTRDRSPLRGPFLSFAPWLPMFADRLTRQTIIFVPTGGVYILPPLINFYGKMFSVAELIASGYASLVADGGPMTAMPSIAPFFHPTPLLGGGVPRLSRSTGSFVGGIRSEYDSFDIPRHKRKLVYIDGSDERDNDDDRRHHRNNRYDESEDDDDDRRRHRNDRYDERKDDDDDRRRHRNDRYDDDDDDGYGRRDSNSDEKGGKRPRPGKRTSTMRTTTDKDERMEIEWKRCSNLTVNNTKVECGWLSVPQDHSQPRGTKIQIALARVKHTVPKEKYQGVMLIIAGVASSGILTMNISQYLPSEISGAYDWIGFDPRGVGASKPALSCVPDYFEAPRPPYIPVDQHIENVWLNRSKAYAQACGKKYGKLLDHMTTLDVVKDIERIRIALDEDKLNLLGLAQSGYTCEVYATLYPSRVRRLVLDGSIDPDQVWFDYNLKQNLGSDRNIQLWFQWLAKYNRVYHLGDSAGEVEYRWKKVMKELEAHPANGQIGQAEWLDIAWLVGLEEFFWDITGEVFSEWVHNKNESLLISFYETLAQPTEDSYAVYLGTFCTDTQWPKDWDYVRTQNWRSYAKAPIVTWQNAWYNGPCSYWPGKSRTLVDVDGSKVKDALLLGGTLNTLNPYEGSLDIRRRFPQARLVTVTNYASSAVLFQKIECVDALVAEYLATGELPERKSDDDSDVDCAPPPKPIPAALNETRGFGPWFKKMERERPRHRGERKRGKGRP